jgi:hypothetical protein
VQLLLPPGRIQFGSALERARSDAESSSAVWV